MEETKIEMYYQNEAKQLVDTLFDGGLFKEGVTRDNMKGIEDLIAYILQSNAQSARKTADFMARWNLKKS